MRYVTESARYTPRMAQAAARRGAKWMDKHCPGWTLLIDLHKLDLQSPQVCILGQTAHCVTEGEVDSNEQDSYNGALGWLVYGNGNKITRLGYNEFAIAYGFNTPSNLGWGGTPKRTRYEMLTLAWLEEIRARGEQADQEVA